MVGSGRMHVSDLKPNMNGVDLTVRVVEVVEEKDVRSRKDGSEHHLRELLVGDESASVVLSLWDEKAKLVEPGDVISIKNGYTTVVRGSLRLNVGKYGKIEKVNEAIEANTTRNMSEEKVRAPRRFSMPSPRRFGRRF